VVPPLPIVTLPLVAGWLALARRTAPLAAPHAACPLLLEDQAKGVCGQARRTSTPARPAGSDVPRASARAGTSSAVGSTPQRMAVIAAAQAPHQCLPDRSACTWRKTTSSDGQADASWSRWHAPQAGDPPPARGDTPRSSAQQDSHQRASQKGGILDLFSRPATTLRQMRYCISVCPFAHSKKK
jgi:hypothetical protein